MSLASMCTRYAPPVDAPKSHATSAGRAPTSCYHPDKSELG